MSIFIFLFTFSYIFLAHKRLDWAIYLILIFLASYQIRFDFLGLPITVLEIMILSAFSVWLIKNYKQIKNNLKSKITKTTNVKKNRYPFDVEIILLLFVSYLAVGIAGFNNDALGLWKAYFFEAVLFFVLFFNVFRKKKLTGIFYSLSLGAFLVSLIAIYQKATGQFIFNPFWADADTRRVTGVFSYPNALGLYLGPIASLLFFQIIEKIKNQKSKIKKFEFCKLSFLFLSFVVSILAIYFAKSEAALLAVIISIFSVSFFINKKTAITLLVLAILSLGIVFSQANLRSYALEKIQLKDLSGEIRKQQWRETWQMMTSSPQLFIFGTGLSAYQKNISPYHQEGIFFNDNQDPEFQLKLDIWDERYKADHWQPVEIYMYPHNFFLNFWTELGLLGLFLFSWLTLKFFYITIKLYRKGSENKFILLGLFSAMFVIMIHGLVDVPYLKNDLAILFWLLFGILGIIKIKSEKT